MGSGSVQYLLIKQRGVLRLALPARNVRKQLLGLDYFQVFTRPARLWRFAVRAIVRARVARWTFPVIPVDELPLPINSLEFCKGVLQNDREFIFQFPKMPHRRKYSILSETPQGLRYLKIALDEKSKKELIREFQTRDLLEQTRFTSFQSPRLVHHFELQDVLVNEFEALPPGCRTERVWLPVHQHIWNELSSVNHRIQPAEQTAWYHAIQAAGGRHWATHLKGKKLHFSFVHGDFTPWNILFKNNRVYLIDYEEADGCGPYLFDPLHYFLVASSIGTGNPLEEFRRIRKSLKRLHTGEDFEHHLLAALLHERFMVQVLEPWMVDRLIEQTVDKILAGRKDFFSVS
ncbi:MAG: hypothetical protein D6715_08120 [Calditrichaeota bacterium]|nr:MAG: hypothetical protein D6715_08120 [Calditrichota bacterium]